MRLVESRESQRAVGRWTVGYLASLALVTIRTEDDSIQDDLSMSVVQQSWRAGFSCQLPQKRATLHSVGMRQEHRDEYSKAV